MAEEPRVFISYARQDGEQFATVLRDRIEREEPEITLWQDRARMEGGVGWWKQITDALDVVQFLVLVMTPAAIRSPVVGREWRYARQRGVCIYPVKGVADSVLDYARLPRWMSKAHFFDLEREWKTFINHLKSPCQTTRVPFMVPDLPEGFVERPALFAELVSYLLDADHQNPVAVTTALQGAGGLGKTTLAAALCHHDDVISAFDDGILWLTLGERPNVQEGIAKLYVALTGERPGFVDAEDATFHLAEKLEDKNCLIVIDDAWDAAHLRPFLRGGKACTRLITTRNFDVAANAKRVNVDEMTMSEALQMLTARLASPPSNLTRARALAERLGKWPLMLELAGATLRHRIGRGDTPDGALNYLSTKLDKQGMVAFDQRNPTERHQAIERTIEVSLELLDPRERQQCVELAIFPEDVDIPLSVVSALLGMDDFDTEEFIQRLDNFSLLRFILQTGTIRLHDVMRAYLATQLADPSVLHAKLVDIWGDPHHLPLSYAWSWLPYHLVEAGRDGELRHLLLDFDWLQAKLEALEAISLIADYDLLAPDVGLRLMQDAIRLSTHVVAKDKTQLAGQLLGRLPVEGSSEIQALRERAVRWRGAPWLRPLMPGLTAPGGPLLLTLTGHTAGVRAVVVTPDGQHAISASDDNTVKVWNLDRGAEDRTLTGHTDWVRVVAAFSDGRRAISGSDDHTLRVWDTETGTLERTIDVYSAWIRAVAVTPDGRYVVCASDDRTLKVWDLEHNTEQCALKGHEAKVNTVVVSPDGRYAISGSDDRTVRVWDIEHGAELRTLKGHAAKVNAVAIAPDGRYIISASSDDTLRLWDLTHSEEPKHRTISKGAYWVKGIAVTSDGQHVITASEDQTLRIWNLERGTEDRTLRGHSDWVNAVAVTLDGRYAISSSNDHTLKVWDLKRSEEEQTFKGHDDRVRAVLVTGNGQHAISTSDDRTLRVWDVRRVAEIRLFKGHNHWVVAVTPDGQWVISAAGDATIRVWNLQDGAEQCRFLGHSDRVRALTTTPDGQRAVSASDDRTLRVWDLKTGTQKLKIEVHTHWVRALAVTPNGRYVISASDGHALKVWDLHHGTEDRTLREHGARVNGVAVTPDGQYAVSASDDHTLKVWNLEKATEDRTLRGHAARVNAVTVTRNGRYAISASDDCTLKVWNLESNAVTATFSAESPLLACSVAPDGATIVAGDQSGHMHFLFLEVSE